MFLMDADAEKVYMSDFDMAKTATLRELGSEVSNKMMDLGRQTFSCPCGRMMWIEGIGWLVSFDFVARLARAIREGTPDDYKRLMATLSVIMPEEISRVEHAIGHPFSDS
jgi:hypothetical protein